VLIVRRRGRGGRFLQPPAGWYSSEHLTAHEAIAAHNPAQILPLPTAGIAAEGASLVIGPRALPRISEVALRRSRSQGAFGEPGH
jgi:hypothetical protein